MKIFVLLCLLTAGSVSPAYAYLDPGAASMIVSVLVSAGVAVGTTVVLFWQKIKAFFSKKRNE
jgi:hypothetical protein